MKYLSICSGIEAATVAWHPLGWELAGVAEIEPYPCHVLARHWAATAPRTFPPEPPDPGPMPVKKRGRALTRWYKTKAGQKWRRAKDAHNKYIAAAKSCALITGGTVPNFGDFTTITENDYAPESINLLVGGTPCQAFSVAGLRGGMDDPRGNLALGFVQLAARLRPRWIVWENVPGVLSSNGGRDFGAFLGALGQLGYGWAYRVLDAQYFGVPQRRRRVFVVGCLGSQANANAVLFDAESLRGNPPPRKETRARAAALSANGVGCCGADDNQAQARHLVAARMVAFGEYAIDGTASTLKQRDHKDATDLVVAHTLRGEGFDASEDGTGRGTPIVVHGTQDPIVSEIGHPLGTNSRAENVVAVAFQQNASGEVRTSDDVAGTVATNGNATGRNAPLVAIPILEPGKRTGKSTTDQRAGLGVGEDGEPMYTLQAGAQHGVACYENHAQDCRVKEITVAPSIAAKSGTGGGNLPLVHRPEMQVRRLTPRECERLQGFPDDYTIAPTWPRRGQPDPELVDYFRAAGHTPELARHFALNPDGPRYKALGNSMAVPVMRWLGERIALVEDLLSSPSS